MKLARALKTFNRSLQLAGRYARAELRRLDPTLKAVPTALASHAVPTGTASLAGVPESLIELGLDAGGLRMLAQLPTDDVAAGRPLIVLLHGCGQDAARFAEQTGWTSWAEQRGIPLLLPEQSKANNVGRCFRWFDPVAVSRAGPSEARGEAVAIAAMTRLAVERFRSDPTRVFVAGLSAGGAMAVALVTLFPELYAGGASVAGLPFGAAESMVQAMRRMAGGGPARTPEEWTALARSAAPVEFQGRWPKLSIWQGAADETVAPGNALALAQQWCGLHGASAAPTCDVSDASVRHRMWGEDVELWTLEGLRHGYPIGDGPAAPFMLQGGPAATPRIAHFWGLD